MPSRLPRRPLRIRNKTAAIHQQHAVQAAKIDLVTLLVSVVVAVSFFNSVGCSPELGAAVGGLVTLDGEPLQSGTVTFFPEAGGAACYGVIGDDGNYVLSTGSRPSLTPGSYRVTVVATEKVEAKPGQTPPIGKLLTPPAYGALEKTPLEFEVKTGSNTIDIEITK